MHNIRRVIKVININTHHNMALVMLPCDLPWWSTVHKKLDLVQHSDTLDAMLEHMQKIHDLCKYDHRAITDYDDDPPAYNNMCNVYSHYCIFLLHTTTT